MTQDLVAFSRERIEKGSKSFAAAARLFAPDTRASAYMLYAWCRHCDDVIDGQTLGFQDDVDRERAESALVLAKELERKTREACDGRANEPVFEALKVVCLKHEIPSRYPLDLIEGFKMDAHGQTYATLEDTLTYCYHVAGVVGVMMAMIMGVRQSHVLDRACDLGLAFQLTNIARDVVADHEAGRVYLPSEWLAEAGLDTTNMVERDNRPALFGVVDRLLTAAEPYYQSASVGIRHLPFRSAWAVAAARSVYREIGQEVRRRNVAAWDTRARTSGAQKLVGVSAGLGAAVGSRLGNSLSAEMMRRDGLWTRADLGS